MSNNHELTQENFETVIANAKGTVLVDFWAPWCGPCRQLAPVIEELAGEHPGHVYKVNVDNAPDLAQKFGVRSIPTLIFFKGGQPAETIVGVHSKAALAAKLG